MHESAKGFYEIYPKSIPELRKIVRIAFKNSIPLRIRGNGHSLNASSLPKKQELLIRTNFLNWYRFEKEGTITVASGNILWKVNDLLKQFKYDLPVINQGYAGPTVGGYISAGGISSQSKKKGGFWNHVEEVTIITGTGKLQTITKKEPLFSYLFGSMGELGIIVEAKLRIYPTADVQYPQGKTGTLPTKTIAQNHRLEKLKVRDKPQYYWFGLFISADKKEEAIQEAEMFFHKYKKIFQIDDMIVYSFPYKGIPIPLLFPENKSFNGIEFRGFVHPQKNKLQLKKMEKEYMNFVLAKGYRRYIQVEFSQEHRVWKRYFGNEIYSQLYHYKKLLDPKFLFHREDIFSFKE
ncbi:MAG: FAD-binding oxidoreductase [Spirochaetota bacterium]